MWIIWAAAVTIVIASPLLAHFGRRLLRRREQLRLANIRRQFGLRREWLEAEFMQVAGSLGRPRGLEWVDCDFADEVAFARDRRTGQLTALVAVGIQFAAVEGGGMEDVEAVANQKAATAVFRHEDGRWRTEGRAVFNLNPAETIRYYESELEMVE